MSELRSQNQNSELKTNLKYRAYSFSIAIVKFVASLQYNNINKVLSDQLLRSATSIGANIVEAKAASSKKDF